MEEVVPVYGTGPLLLIALGAVAVLLVLIMVLRLHAFVALILVSPVTALVARIPVGDAVNTVLEGFGTTLASVALLVGLGAMIGKLLEVTGEPLGGWRYVVPVPAILAGGDVSGGRAAANDDDTSPGTYGDGDAGGSSIGTRAPAGPSTTPRFSTVLLLLLPLDVKTTLKTWTVMATLIGLVGFALALVASLIL